MSSDSTPHSAASSVGDFGSPELETLLQDNLDRVHARIRDAVAAAGPEAKTPQLIAVTKTVPAEMTELVGTLLPAPCHLAENRADVFVHKVAALANGPVRPRWHFIGSIQRNKARRIVEHADVLHAIDSTRLAATVVRLAEEFERDVEVFLEVNLTGEEEKHGLAAVDLPAVIAILTASPRTQIAGLMAMGPARGLRTVDEVFGQVAELSRDLETSHPDAFIDGTCRLSMGMSGDLEAAILHGTDYVRIGSALFEGWDPAPPSSQGPTSR